MLFELSSVVVILPAWGFFSMCAGISSFPHSRIEFKGLGSRNRGGETFQHQFSYLNFFIVNSFFFIRIALFISWSSHINSVFSNT